MTELNAQPDGLRIPDELLGGMVDPELEEYIRDLVWMQLVRGNDCINDHAFEIASAVEDTEGDDTLSDEQCRAIAQYLIDARRAQQAGFGDVPATRLNRAFEALRRAHVVAEQDFACCNTCGHAEIEGGQGDLGYVFFHQQDTEGLVESGSTLPQLRHLLARSHQRGGVQGPEQRPAQGALRRHDRQTDEDRRHPDPPGTRHRRQLGGKRGHPHPPHRRPVVRPAVPSGAGLRTGAQPRKGPTGSTRVRRWRR